MSTETITMHTPSATCGSCRAHIQEVMSDIDGVSDADLDVATNTTSVTYDPAVLDAARVERIVVDAGYPVQR